MIATEFLLHNYKTDAYLIVNLLTNCLSLKHICS